MELMSRALVLLDVEASSKEEVIQRIADAMEADGRLIDKAGYIGDVEKREQDSSTAVGYMVVTPSPFMSRNHHLRFCASNIRFHGTVQRRCR